MAIFDSRSVAGKCQAKEGWRRRVLMSLPPCPAPAEPHRRVKPQPCRRKEKEPPARSQEMPQSSRGVSRHPAPSLRDDEPLCTPSERATAEAPPRTPQPDGQRSVSP